MDYLSEIKTLEERDRLISEIESYKRKDMNSIRQSFLDLIPTVDIDSLYKNLKKIEIVRVILAIEPSAGISNLINEFFRTNYNKKVIFDYEVDKEILGGIKIIFKGNYYDFSI